MSEPPITDRYDRFVALFARHERAVRGVIRSMLPSSQDADDVMQEVGLACWHKFADFKADDSARGRKERRRLQFDHHAVWRRGSLSADVTPQPADSPMVVQTSSAEIQVLGTQFNVTARTTETALAVNEGRVSFLRSSDGKVLEVPAEHLAIASLDPAENFTVQRRGPHVTTWQSRLESDAEVLHGYWKPALFELESRLKQAVATGDMTEAEALAEYKKAVDLNGQGSVWAKPSRIGCLVWLDVRAEEQRRVLLTDHTRFRITGRLFASTNVEMGISTYAVDGGFQGKYIRSISTQKLNRSAESNFEWVVNVGDFLPKSGESAAGSLVHDWWCVTESNTAKLEIVRVEVLDR